MACSKRSLCKQVACEWDIIVVLSEIRLKVCFFFFKWTPTTGYSCWEKKNKSQKFKKKIYRRMAMNKEDTRGFHTTFRDLVWCTSQWNPIHLSTLWQILKLKRLSYLYVKLQWNRSHVWMEVEQSSRPNSKPLRNILRLQAEQNFVSLITLHLRPILKIHSIGTWLFNLFKITFTIYKP